MDVHEASGGDKSDGDALKERDLLSDATHNLMTIFREMAPAESLTRALFAERAGERDRAEFWIRVYFECRARPGTATGHL